jgi:PRC-barrel domain
LIGAPVRNEEGHLIGTIDGVVLSNDGQVAVVIVVGSDLGFGEREVAVNLKSLRLSKDENNNLVVTLNATKDALKNAPEWTQPQ